MSKQAFGKYIYLAFAIFNGIWILYRSVTLSITNDEAFTFYNIATCNIKMMFGTANTHWINSIAIFFETLLIGNKEWMIRIHSFIAYIVFAWALYKICKQQIKFSWQLFVPLALLVLNTYLLDFFSLARGYGISLAFETMAFYAILNNDNTIKKRFQVYLFLALATFSCYTCIFILFSYFIYDFTDRFQKEKFQLLVSKENIVSWMPLLLVCVTAIPNILFIRHEGDLDEGQSNGLMADTFGVFFERSYPVFSNAGGLFIFCSILFLSLCIFYLRFSAVIDKNIKVLFKIFFINILLIEFFYFAFKIPYVFGRTALYIDLLLLLLIVYVVIFYLNKLSKTVGAFFCSVLLALSTYNLLFYKNQHTTVEWWKTQGIEKCIKDLEVMEGNKMYNKKIGMHLAQLGSYTNYYQFLYKSSLNDTVYSFCEDKNGRYDSLTLANILVQDYVIMLKPYSQYFDDESYVVLKYYKDMNADLIRINK